jgi:hypothetical protein
MVAALAAADLKHAVVGADAEAVATAGSGRSCPQSCRFTRVLDALIATLHVVLRLANSTPYGLAATAWTRDLGTREVTGARHPRRVSGGSNLRRGGP